MLCYGTNPILRITDVITRQKSYGDFSVAPSDCAVLFFLNRGKVTVTCSGKEYYVNTYGICYLPQNTAYTITYTDAEMIAIYFVTMASSDTHPEVYALHGSQSFYELFSWALNHWNSKQPGYELYTISILYRILCTIQTRTRVPSHLLKAIAFIHANYRNSDLTIGQICAHIGISQTVFRQHFKTYYQKSPVEYITALRMMYARSLIFGGTTVETAAHQSGFNDPKYFARVVKKYFGCTPRELRSTDG